MKPGNRTSLLVASLMLAYVLLPGAVRAGAVDVQVTGDIIRVTPGSVTEVWATISNPGTQTVHINGITSGVTADLAHEDVFDPFSAVGPGMLGPGESWEGPVLRLTVSPVAAPAVRIFDLTFTGGDHPYATETICNAYFAVDDSTVVAGTRNEATVTTALHANPNPFRQRQEIEFAAAAAGTYEVSVFDAAGKRVRALHSRAFGAGLHHIGWDGKSDAGASLPAGVYFLRVSNGGRPLKTKVVKLE